LDRRGPWHGRSGAAPSRCGRATTSRIRVEAQPTLPVTIASGRRRQAGAVADTTNGRVPALGRAASGVIRRPFRTPGGRRSIRACQSEAGLVGGALCRRQW
jgi:hypothetical protein